MSGATVAIGDAIRLQALKSDLATLRSDLCCWIVTGMKNDDVGPVEWETRAHQIVRAIAAKASYLEQAQASIAAGEIPSWRAE